MANALAPAADILDSGKELAALLDISGPSLRVRQALTGELYRDVWRDSSCNDLLKRVLAGDKTEKPLADEEICAEVGSQMIGGTNTMSITLTYTGQELSREEVRVDTGVPKYADLEKLKLLDALVTENPRFHLAAPASLPRPCPKGDAKIAGRTT